jgi:hypothetical protein
MPATTFYPTLSTLIPLDRLPAGDFLGNALAQVFDHLYYRDLQVVAAPDGAAASYRLKILTYRRLALEVPGTGGLALVLNPSLSAPSTSSEFKLTADYRWSILKYAADFDLQSFDFSGAAIFDLILDIAGVTKEQLLSEVFSVLSDDPAPIQQFVALVNQNYSPATPLAVTSLPTDEEIIEDLLEQLLDNGNDLDAYLIVFEHYIQSAGSADDILRRIEELFARWLGRFSSIDLQELLIPRIRASIDALRIGLQFPRAVLREVDASGKPVPDPNNPGEDKPALLAFDMASLRFSTEKGFEFDLAPSFNVSVPRCEILKSGLILDIHDLKVDFSRTTNIPEATADGRPADFVGVYVKDGTITFPASWNPDPASTAIIKARNLLIGTGGISGTLALEAAAANVAKPVVKLTFGKDFSVSLDKFKITLKQNAITDTVIEGTLVIPGFKDANDNPAEIRIKVDIRQDGDFDITAHEDDGFKTISFPGVFDVTLKSVFFGKKDDDFYLGVAGSIRFTHDLLKDAIKEPVEIEKLLIWSDGRFEIEGGTIPLPQNLRFPIGPAELSISAIHLGSHQQTYSDGTTTKFQYFGFDGGVDINPGGVDVRGKGIKFYFPVDGSPLSRSYLEIKSLAIDLVIPGSASRESAQLLISGYLSVGGSAGDPEYEGGVSFALPKVKIAGGASMKYRPKYPAFLVDAFVEFAVPLPFGATSLGFYAFRALFGLHYVATKHAAQLDDTKSWFDYYKVKAGSPLQEGISVSKFETPDDTGKYDNAFSIGAGVALADMQSSGKTFSCKLFLLLSLPDLIYLEGKANILGERVGLTGEDPMFFALLAVSSQSVELGVGVTYKLPKDGAKKGQILDLSAEMRAAFFFKNKRAWFINMGTPQNPTTARVLTLFDATSYLMLSASGIAAGAGVTFGFNKSYAGGMVHASVGVYLKLAGFISFQGPQIGGSVMLGGHVDVSLMWFSFYIVLDTSLSVEVPRPFYIEGSVHLCVGITIGFWKFKKHIDKCFDVAFRWEKETQVDTQGVLPFADVSAGELPPFSATNMLSGETFTVASFGSQIPPPSHPGFDSAVLPLDTWVDIEFLKGLIPGPNVDARIGRLSGAAPANAVDYVPPAEVAHKVKHQYAITEFEIRTWSGANWVDYRPYEAMSPPDALAALAASPGAYKDGFWMNTGDGFNKIRLLAETSLSYMQQGQPGWYIPEQMGITSASLFCKTKLRDEHCVNWTAVLPQTTYSEGQWQQKDTVLYRLNGGAGLVLNWNQRRVLAFPNEAVAEIVLPKASARVTITITTFSSSAIVRFLSASGLVETRTLTQLQLLAPVVYDDPSKPVTRIEVAPAHPDSAAVYALQVEIDSAYRKLYETGTSNVHDLEQKLAAIEDANCKPRGITAGELEAVIHDLQGQVAQCGKDLAALQAAQSQACKDAHDFQIKFGHCFPSEPSIVSYSLTDDHRFQLHDDRSDTVIFASAGPYASDAAAETALFAAIDLGRKPGSYALLNPGPHQYFFRIGNIATSPAIFKTFDDLKEFVTGIIEALQQPGFALARRSHGKSACNACPEHVECWDDIPMVAEYDDHCQPVSIVSAHDVFCRTYDTMYRQLYAENKKRLQELLHRCEELTHALDGKKHECAVVSQQLAAAVAAGHGPIRPPDGMPCSTLLQEVCYLTLDDYEVNLTIPGQAAIEQDYQSAVDAVAKMLTPIWRPHQKYSIRLQVKDTVNGADTAPRDFYFGFRTAGPLGYWHADPAVQYVKAPKTPEQYMLTGLKGYVDYRRSYPDPGGNVIGAKPLFYEDARILLFFTKRYVYHFFGPWPAYNGLPAITTNAMQIVIKDPAEKTSIPNPPPPTMITTEVPQAVVSWPRDDDPRIPEDVRTLLQLRNPELLNPNFEGGECWVSGGEMITPASVHTEIIPKYLKPLKLYTAIVNSVENGAVSTVLDYVFQTSRYADFHAQINSYRLDDGKGNQRDAVFEVHGSLSPGEVQLMYDIVTGTMSAANAALAGKWADPFDRLVQGVLAQQPLEPAIGTEFNVIRNTATGAVIAVWLRNPEPFNDPKLPDDVLPRTVNVIPGSNPDSDYNVLFSRDRSQAMVMHPSRIIPVTQVKFRFAYVEWDGSDYVDHAVVTTGWIRTH